VVLALLPGDAVTTLDLARLAWSRPAFLAYGAAAAIALAAAGGLLQQDSGRREPVVAEATKRAADWDFTVDTRKVQIPDVPKRDARKLAKRFNRPDLAEPRPEPTSPVSGPPSAPAAEILRNDEDRRPAPGGVEVLTVLEPDGRVTNTILPLPPKMFPGKIRWYAEALTDEFRLPASIDDLAIRVGAEFRAVALLGGRLELVPKAEVFREPLPVVGLEPDTGARFGLRVTWE